MPTKKKSKPAAKKFNAQEAARKLTPKLFEQLCEVALTKTGTTAGFAAWQKVWELSGEEIKPAPKIIKVKFIDIFSTADGEIREIGPAVPIEPPDKKSIAPTQGLDGTDKPKP